jgi:ketosteroid isomerase-like protein
MGEGGPDGGPALARAAARAPDWPHMSEENVALVQAIYSAWNEGRSARELIADDLEYVNPAYAVEPGLTRGRGTLARVRDVYPDFRVEVERYVDAGDEVVVVGTARGTGASGLEVQWRQGYVWTLQDGKAVRFRWFNDPAEAFVAVGLEPGQ